jgi:hypothetical protein
MESQVQEAVITSELVGKMKTSQSLCSIPANPIICGIDGKRFRLPLSMSRASLYEERTNWFRR